MFGVDDSKFSKTAIAIGLLSVFAVPTKAAVIFESFPLRDTGVSVSSSSVFQTFVFYFSPSEATVGSISWLGYGGLENNIFDISVYETDNPFVRPDTAPIFRKISTPDSSVSHAVSGYLYSENLGAGFHLEAEKAYQISIWSADAGFSWLEGRYRCCTITYNSATQVTWSQGMYPAYGLYSAENPSPAVPEPLTWAMMLVGFGTIGMQLRRQKAALS